MGPSGPPEWSPEWNLDRCFPSKSDETFVGRLSSAFMRESRTVVSTVSMRTPFAANLRGHRERLGLSQEALGSMCGLHRTEISLLERRKRSPRLETIVVLARALELKSPAELLDGIP